MLTLNRKVVKDVMPAAIIVGIIYISFGKHFVVFLPGTPS